ncbi:mitochondrial ribosomal protein subunit L20-domain-containing protein [Echria macrotheca]|uniref:Mitochondrial ribosomal protein subunit L20-domain-containing protein n=1 Tax=Echria macrotheca TaxID=438768 RepID=A0AAJ0F9R7_9PEZI|nr:mitochondrial ribosomal protein subunit L20-domain-containing protein [Echria macrotheca]
MEVQLTRRPVASCCRRLASSPLLGHRRPTILSPATAAAPSTTTPTQTRHKATASRTKRALNIAPHKSFLSPSSSNTTSQKSTHVIFNPPSAAPSVYHTPFKFLPKTDPRRRANLPANLFASSSTIQFSSTPTTTSASVTALPTVGPASPKKYHLTPEDVQQMRELRAADPVRNSVASLANRFGCSKLFVIFCCQSSPQHRDKIREAIAAEQARWGPRKMAAFQERARRRQMLLDGEL